MRADMRYSGPILRVYIGTHLSLMTPMHQGHHLNCRNQSGTLFKTHMLIGNKLVVNIPDSTCDTATPLIAVLDIHHLVRIPTPACFVAAFTSLEKAAAHFHKLVMVFLLQPLHRLSDSPRQIADHL